MQGWPWCLKSLVLQSAQCTEAGAMGEADTEKVARQLTRFTEEKKRKRTRK